MGLVDADQLFKGLRKDLKAMMNSSKSYHFHDVIVAGRHGVLGRLVGPGLRDQDLVVLVLDHLLHNVDEGRGILIA